MKAAEIKDLRIVLVSFDYWPPDFGGELLLTIERLQTLARRGHSVVALTRRPPGAERGARDAAINLRRCPVQGGGFVARAAYLLWAASALLRLSFEAVHLGRMPAIHA